MLQHPGRVRRLIVAAAIAGFLIRLAFALLYWVGKPLTHDEREYLELARSLSEGRGFAYAPSSESGPGPRFGRARLPMLLAASVRRFDLSLCRSRQGAHRRPGPSVSGSWVFALRARGRVRESPRQPLLRCIHRSSGFARTH